jgi:predicted RNA binding protein YcfA (HicA-like mRNA interferase family)
MAYPRNVWNQLKNITADELIKALEKDDWTLDSSHGSIRVYIKQHSQNRRVSVHWHPKKTFGRKTLTGLLDAISWSEDDLQRLKLIKGKKRKKGEN